MLSWDGIKQVCFPGPRDVRPRQAPNRISQKLGRCAEAGELQHAFKGMRIPVQGGLHVNARPSQSPSTFMCFVGRLSEHSVSRPQEALECRGMLQLGCQQALFGLQFSTKPGYAK